MDFSTFLTTFGLIFVAEFGDKTQLAVMTMASRLPGRRVMLGAALAFALLGLLAVSLGRLLFVYVPPLWIALISAGLFLFFGLQTLLAPHEEGEEEETRAPRRAHGAVVTAFVLIFFAELGDKTQLMTAQLSASSESLLAVFAGATLALWAVALLGIVAGRQLARLLPRKMLARLAGALFILFALFTLWRAWRLAAPGG